MLPTDETHEPVWLVIDEEASQLMLAASCLSDPVVLLVMLPVNCGVARVLDRSRMVQRIVWFGVKPDWPTSVNVLAPLFDTIRRSTVADANEVAL